MAERLRAVCGGCGKETNHDVLASRDNRDRDPEAFEEFQIIQCLGCESYSFRHLHRSFHYGFAVDGVFPAREFLYPPRHLIRTPVDLRWLPPKIRRVHRNVHFALRSELRAFGAFGVRAVVEMTCKQQGADGHNLHRRIEELHRMQRITEDQKQALHAQRLLGNDAAHDFAEPNDDELAAAMDVLDSVLDAIYIMPKRKRAMERLARQRSTTLQ